MPSAGLAGIKQLSTVCNESNYITDFGGHTSNNLVEIQNPNLSIFGKVFSLSLLKLITKIGVVYISLTHLKHHLRKKIMACILSLRFVLSLGLES